MSKIGGILVLFTLFAVGCGIGVRIDEIDTDADGKPDYAIHKRGGNIFMTRSLNKYGETHERFHWMDDGRLTKIEFFRQIGSGKKTLWVHYFKNHQLAPFGNVEAWRCELDVPKSYPKEQWDEVSLEAVFARGHRVIHRQMKETE